MKILLLTQWFDPEPTFKGLLFAKELQRRGHEVEVLTGFPNYPGGHLYPGFRMRPFRREVVDGIPVLRVALYPSHDGSAVHRVLNYGSFAASASIASLFIRRPDVVYVYHPPATVGIPALVLKHLRGVPFVYDVQDLWPETLAATGMVSNRRVLGLVDLLVRGVYRGAAEVVVLSPGFRAALLGKGVPPETVTVIPNWAHEDRISVAPRDSSTVHAGAADPFTVLFAGTMGLAQALDTVLDAAELLRAEEEIHFVLVGGGIDSERLEAEARRRQLTNVTFLPRRPTEEVGELLTGADALLVHLKDGPLFAITIPSKTQAYLMAGRPVLMGVRGDAARLVEEAAAGLTFPPEDAEALAAAVRSLRSSGRAAREEMGVRGAQFYRERLSVSAGTDAFVQVLRRATLRKPRLEAAKRAADVVGSVAALAVTAPAMAVVAALVRRRLGGPVVFKHQRPGRGGRPFTLYKFRTMTDDRGDDGEPLPDGQRITPLGARLRQSSLDELPELWNVLKGDMSFVGPRPLLTRYSEFFTPEERHRLLIRPGITGWAQVNGRNTAVWDDRLAMDVWYVRNRSLLLDLRILTMTAARVFRRSGVVVDPESVMANFDDERRQRGVTR